MREVELSATRMGRGWTIYVREGELSATRMGRGRTIPLPRLARCAYIAFQLSAQSQTQPCAPQPGWSRISDTPARTQAARHSLSSGGSRAS